MFRYFLQLLKNSRVHNVVIHHKHTQTFFFEICENPQNSNPIIREIQIV